MRFERTRGAEARGIPGSARRGNVRPRPCPPCPRGGAPVRILGRDTAIPHSPPCLKGGAPVRTLGRGDTECRHSSGSLTSPAATGGLLPSRGACTQGPDVVPAERINAPSCAVFSFSGGEAIAFFLFSCYNEPATHTNIEAAVSRSFLPVRVHPYQR